MTGIASELVRGIAASLARLRARHRGRPDVARIMVELAAQQPGFLGIESVRGADGRGITVSYWRSGEAIAAWKAHLEHRAAQQEGIRRWYAHYSVRVARVERAYERTIPRHREHELDIRLEARQPGDARVAGRAPALDARGLSSGEHPCARRGRTAQAGRHALERLGLSGASGLRRLEGARCDARRDQIHANRRVSAEARRRQRVAPPHPLGSETAGLHEIEPRNGIDGVLRAREELVSEVRVQGVSAVRRLRRRSEQRVHDTGAVAAAPRCPCHICSPGASGATKR